MIRFEKKEHLKILIFISDLIRKISGGDRTKRISKKIEHLLKNPILGAGIGNWKIWSVKYDSKNIENYIN